MRKVLFCVYVVGVLFDKSIGMNQTIENSADGVRKFVSEVSVLLSTKPTEAIRAINDTMDWIVSQKKNVLDEDAKVTMLDAIDRNFGEQMSTIRLAAQRYIMDLVTSDTYNTKGYGVYIWRWIDVDKKERGTEEFVRAAISKLYTQDQSFLQNIAPQIVLMGMRLFLPSMLTYSWK